MKLIGAGFGRVRNDDGTADSLLRLKGIGFNRHFLHGFRVQAQIGRAVSDIAGHAQPVHVEGVAGGTATVGADAGKVFRVEIVRRAVGTGNARSQGQQLFKPPRFSDYANGSPNARKLDEMGIKPLRKRLPNPKFGIRPCQQRLEPSQVSGQKKLPWK